MKNFDELIQRIVASGRICRVAVAAANEPSVLEAAAAAKAKGWADFHLVGQRDRIEQIAAKGNIDLSGFQIHSQGDDNESAARACELVRQGEADLLMKGYLQTRTLLKAVLDRDRGLRGSGIMSHAFLVEDPTRHKFLIVTDAALIIAPDLEKKAMIVQNAVRMAVALGVARPKVACLGAIEEVNPAMPDTLDAAALSKMADRGQFGVPCDVDGPLALDNALNEAAAKQKKINSPVAGNADILLAPNIEAGNILGKATVFLCGWRTCGIVLGAACPIILTSRADTIENKLLSVATAVYLAGAQHQSRQAVASATG